MSAHAETRPTSESTSECLVTHQEQVYIEASEPEAAELLEDEMDDSDEDSAIETIETNSTASLTSSRVLDVGTGSGLWAIEFADEYPHTHVVGTDISPVQPEWVPPNLDFQIDDCTKDWTWDDNYFDFVHLRGLTGSIKHWPDLFSQVYRHTKPGGLVESHEASFRIRSDYNNIEPEGALAEMGDIFEEAGNKTGCKFNVADNNTQRESMEKAGFVIIRDEKLIMPIGEWSDDPKLKKTGEKALEAFTHDLGGYMLYVMTQVLKRDYDAAQVFLVGVRKELRQDSMRLYVEHHVVVGQKPKSESGPSV
ncbi:hypothetical protein FALBO_3021 [Fusarium albosuccineum]|uniref:Methyltransferase n=1 Tax=Fusarium albosuccineum TaxID=1237068 RepID=A0A8H4LJT2_9HYPO|nr:hypothetical protein FALBO_3021 [Fusarium albosuccineum]